MIQLSTKRNNIPNEIILRLHLTITLNGIILEIVIKTNGDRRCYFVHTTQIETVLANRLMCCNDYSISFKGPTEFGDSGKLEDMGFA